MKRLVTILIIAGLLLAGVVAGYGGQPTAYKINVGDARWYTKLNAGLDALWDNVTDFATLINNWAIEDQIVTMIPVTCAYSDNNTFTLAGDYTSRFTIGAVVQVQVAAGMVYSTVASSSYAAPMTTVNLNDTVLTNPITRVYVIATRDGLWPNGPGYVVAADYGSDQAALATADGLATAAGKQLVVGQTYSITSDLTLSASLKIMPGAILTIAATKTLTINGPLEVGHYQIFNDLNIPVFPYDAYATGVKFGIGSVDRVLPQWFGAKGDNSNDDQLPCQQTANSLAVGQTFYFPNGTYKIPARSGGGNTVRVLASGVKVIGESFGGVTFNNLSNVCAMVIGNNNATDGLGFGTYTGSTPNISKVTVENLNFTGKQGLWVVWAQFCSIKNISGDTAISVLKLANDGTDTVWDTSVDGVYRTGAGSDNWYTFECLSGVRVHAQNIFSPYSPGPSANHVALANSTECEYSNIFIDNTNVTNVGILSTANTRCIIHDFVINTNGSIGLIGNYSGYNIARNNKFYNGIVNGAVLGVKVHGNADEYYNITTKNCTADVELASNCTSNIFWNNNFSGGVLTDGGGLRVNQVWTNNKGILANKTIAIAGPEWAALSASPYLSIGMGGEVYDTSVSNAVALGCAAKVPAGSIITGYVFWVFNMSATNSITVALNKTDIFGAAGTTTIKSDTITNDPSGTTTEHIITLSSPETIDKSKQYLFSVSWNPADVLSRIYGFRVYYQENMTANESAY